jgi:hypothetical protein
MHVKVDVRQCVGANYSTLPLLEIRMGLVVLVAIVVLVIVLVVALLAIVQVVTTTTNNNGALLALPIFEYDSYYL